jgi:hypothetical protein
VFGSYLWVRFTWGLHEINDLLIRGASIRSAWRIVNSSLPTEAKMSYTAFFHFVKKHINKDKSDK